MSSTYKTSLIYFKHVKLSMATIPFPFTEKEFTISNFYSINDCFIKLLINGHVICAAIVDQPRITRVSACGKACCNNSWSFSCCCDLQTCSIFPILPLFMHLTSGLHQHFLCGWFICYLFIAMLGSYISFLFPFVVVGNSILFIVFSIFITSS